MNQPSSVTASKLCNTIIAAEKTYTVIGLIAPYCPVDIRSKKIQYSNWEAPYNANLI